MTHFAGLDVSVKETSVLLTLVAIEKQTFARRLTSGWVAPKTAVHPRARATLICWFMAQKW